MTRYLAGDKSVLRSMRWLGRSLFVVCALGALLTFTLCAAGIHVLTNAIVMTILVIAADVMVRTMRRYGFGLTWHNHVERD